MPLDDPQRAQLTTRKPSHHRTEPGTAAPVAPRSERSEQRRQRLHAAVERSQLRLWAQAWRN